MGAPEKTNPLILGKTHGIMRIRLSLRTLHLNYSQSTLRATVNSSPSNKRTRVPIREPIGDYVENGRETWKLLFRVEGLDNMGIHYIGVGKG